MSFAWRYIRNHVRLEMAGTALTVNGVAIPNVPEPLERPYLDNLGNIAGKGGASLGAWVYMAQVGGQWRSISANAVGYAALDYAGRVFWQEVGVGGMAQPVEAAIGPVAVLGWNYQSPGIRDIPPTGPIVMMDGQPLIITSPRYGSLALPMWMERSDRVLGFANNMPNGNGIVCYDRATDWLYRVWQGDPQGLPACLDDDGKTAAICGDLANGFIPDSLWTDEPMTAPLPDKSRIRQLTQPTIFAAYLHQAGIGPRTFDANGIIDERSPDQGRYLRFDNGGIYQVIDMEQT